MGTPQVGHGSIFRVHGVEWDPNCADPVAFEVKIAEVLVQHSALAGPRVFDKERVLLEVYPLGA